MEVKLSYKKEGAAQRKREKMGKKTFLYEQQLELNAKMVEFALWDMPVQYSGIIDEHNTVREKVGLFDVSHMGEIFVYGKDCLAFLQKLVPPDVAKLNTNKAVYCQLTNKSGGIIDDLIIYKLGEEKYLLIVNASRIDEDLNWIVRNKIGFNVEIENQSHNYALLALQGPFASDLMQDMGLEKENQPEFFHIKETELNNINLFVSRTGYTGEDGFEILVRNEFSQNLWDYILEKGQKYGIKPIGLGARDTLRLEAALLLYGSDMDEKITPIEAGLGWSVAKSKLEDYNGKEIIFAQLGLNKTGEKNNDKETVNLISKKLIGFKMLDKNIARHDYEIFFQNEKIGKVTSGGISPCLNQNIGLGYIETKFNLKIGDIIQIMIRNNLHDAQIVKRPFVDKKSKMTKEK